jgi:hypothetical protein
MQRGSGKRRHSMPCRNAFSTLSKIMQEAKQKANQIREPEGDAIPVFTGSSILSVSWNSFLQQ